MPHLGETKTLTSTITTTIDPVTKTEWCWWFCARPTFTRHPPWQVVTSTATAELVAVQNVLPTVADVLNAMATETATCITPAVHRMPDATARMQVSIAGLPYIAVKTPTVRASKKRDLNHWSAKYRRLIQQGQTADAGLRKAYVEERRVRLVESHVAIVKRAPDVPTITLTSTNTADYPTTTSISTAAPSTVEITTTQVITATVTPPPVTLKKAFWQEIITKWLEQQTFTITHWEAAPTPRIMPVDVTQVSSCLLSAPY